MAKKNKWDSPFGSPGFGKIPSPKDKRDDQDQLRGCGDPNCSMCNPETASRGGGSIYNRPSVTRGFDVEVSINGNPFNASAMERFREEMLRSMRSAYADPRMGGERDSTPKALKEAREAVEKWIVEAPDQAFDDIVGNEDALGQLQDAIRAPVDHKELYEAYGMRMPKGAVLSGPPGCGKTMFARAAASEMRKIYGKGSEFISISGSELQAPYVGVTEGYIKAIFTYAREYKKHHGHPLLVFMDEAEVLLPDRTGRTRKVAPWEESQVATFLAEMDGMQESGAFVLLATNRPEVIDQAVLRDGRCDFKIVVARPTRQAVEVILRKNFDGILTAEPSVEDLVFAASEAFSDPHKVLLNATAIEASADGKIDLKGKAFLLEHIVSGAMAASVPERAKRYAFARDKASGKPTGVTVADVVSAVGDLFEENQNLDHGFALREFVDEFAQEIMAEHRKGMN